MYTYMWMDSRLREKYKLALRDIIKEKKGGGKRNTLKRKYAGIDKEDDCDL